MQDKGRHNTDVSQGIETKTGPDCKAKEGAERSLSYEKQECKEWDKGTLPIDLNLYKILLSWMQL